MAWQSDAVYETINNSPYKSAIFLTGYIGSDLPSIIGSSRALVFPSLFEGFGVPLLEAMYTDIPIITSKGSSLKEVAGEAALLIDPEDVQSIAQAMTDLYEDPQIGRDLVMQGRHQRKKYTWDVATKVISEAIDNAVYG